MTEALRIAMRKAATVAATGIFASLTIPQAVGAVYKYVDDRGQTIFSTVPLPGRTPAAVIGGEAPSVRPAPGTQSGSGTGVQRPASSEPAPPPRTSAPAAGGSVIYKYRDEQGQIFISAVPLPGRTPFETIPVGPPPTASAGTPSSASSSPRSGGGTETGPSFKVPTEVQRARDNDVRRILQGELADQQDLLAKAVSPDDRRRHEANIRELNKELSRVK